jgi:hypothetical protein
MEITGRKVISRERCVRRAAEAQQWKEATKEVISMQENISSPRDKEEPPIRSRRQEL